MEINLFDAVPCFNTLFSDISCVKHKIGLTLFGYFKSSFILWHAPRRGNTFAIGMVQHLHDSYLILLSSTSHNGGTRSLSVLVFVPWCLNIEYHVFYHKGAKELSFHIRSLKSYSHCRNIFFPGFCRFGSQCVDAHSAEELREWKDRFEFRQKKAHKAAKMYGKSFADVVLEKLSAAKNKESVRSFLNFA